MGDVDDILIERIVFSDDEEEDITTTPVSDVKPDIIDIFATRNIDQVHDTMSGRTVVITKGKRKGMQMECDGYRNKKLRIIPPHGSNMEPYEVYAHQLGVYSERVCEFIDMPNWMPFYKGPGE